MDNPNGHYKNDTTSANRSRTDWTSSPNGDVTSSNSSSSPDAPNNQSLMNLGSVGLLSNVNGNVRRLLSEIGSKKGTHVETWDDGLLLISDAFWQQLPLERRHDHEILDEIDGLLGYHGAFAPELYGCCISTLGRYPTSNRYGEFCRIRRLVLSKQADYGKQNILRYGDLGIEVRISDKLERLRHLRTLRVDPRFESVQDSWDDLVGYGMVGLMVWAGWFGLPLERDNND